MGEYTGIERDEDMPKWAYLGEDDQEHSWFTDNEMQKWYESGYFNDHLQVRTTDDVKWFTLQEYIHLCGGGSPFLGGVATEYHQRPQSRPQYTRNLDFFEQQRQQQKITPLPMTHLPQFTIPGYPAPTSGVTPATNGNGTAPHPYFVNANTFPIHPMMIPPGMEQHFEERQMYQHDGFGNERENPSSSSVSETPDSERCLHMIEDMRVSLPTFDKCIGTEDAPWLSRTVDCGTDAPEPTVRVDCGVQTGTVYLKPKDVSRLLKELTGINYYIR